MNARVTVTGSVVLDEIVSRIGWDATVALVRAFGGRIVHIPYKIGTTHRISAVIGHDKAQILADELGGVSWTIPIRLKRDLRVRELAAEGKLTRDEIADQLGIHVHTVYAILARPPMARMATAAPANDAQIDLFDARA